jgi:hypothetical protein
MGKNMANKRQHFRVTYGKELVLRMEDNYVISGQAGDINEGGFFLKPHGSEDFSSRVGQPGTLIIDLQAESLNLACKIIRITPQGLGIQFET